MDDLFRVRQVLKSPLVAKPGRKNDRQEHGGNGKNRQETEEKPPSFYDMFESEQQKKEHEDMELSPYYEQLRQSAVLRKRLKEDDYPAAVQILSRLMKGKPITDEERDFLAQEYPELYWKARLLRRS